MTLLASNHKLPRRTCVHLLSFDVEEYFQVEAAAAGVDPADWDKYPSRLTPCVNRILQLLCEHKCGATFFVLGAVAKRNPRLVRRIADRGFEIASHGMTHRMMGKLSRRELQAELRDSRKLLQDLTGQPIFGFRAPTFSVTLRTGWALDVLAECGFKYDSSVFPIRHDRYGVPDAPTGPHLAAGPDGGQVIEIPPLTLPLAGVNLPAGGGGYLRLLPVRLAGWALGAAARRAQPGMIYLHPWELDPQQPVLPMSRLGRWRHRGNLARTEKKLHWLLDRFRFASIRSLLPAITTMATRTFTYAQNADEKPAGAKCPLPAQVE